VPINEAIRAGDGGGIAEGYFVVQINNSDQLKSILHKLEQVPGVMDAQRTEPK
jgi:(p)ppGpp synthase/HD superfamily hydrolase